MENNNIEEAKIINEPQPTIINFADEAENKTYTISIANKDLKKIAAEIYHWCIENKIDAKLDITDHNK